MERIEAMRDGVPATIRPTLYLAVAVVQVAHVAGERVSGIVLASRPPKRVQVDAKYLAFWVTHSDEVERVVFEQSRIRIDVLCDESIHLIVKAGRRGHRGRSRDGVATKD